MAAGDDCDAQDPAEACDGASALCPVDVVTCDGGVLDGGPDADTRRDGGGHGGPALRPRGHATDADAQGRLGLGLAWLLRRRRRARRAS